MELFVLSLFCTVLITCIGLGLPVLLPLCIGLMIFLGYGIYKGLSLGELLKMCWTSILTVHTILLTFFLIGFLTASWRACGTIPVIVTLSTGFIMPSYFILAVFLLNTLISFLIGTSFGTVATMGVICLSIAKVMMMNLFWTVGAMIACNQSLNIMLAEQLCDKLDFSKEEIALAIEDTAVVVSPLIPWNIAAAVPLATLGASSVCLLAACFLYLLPLYRLFFKPKFL